MDSFPDLPAYNPPPIPTNQQQQQQQPLDRHYQYQINSYDQESAIIPDQILYEIAKQQYRVFSRKLFSEHSKKYRIISLLETSERLFEDAKTYLEGQDYHKTASSYIKGYIIFKFAERLNKNPSSADIINVLRNLYSHTSFTKLKDIVDDVYIKEKEKDEMRMEPLDSRAPTLVEPLQPKSATMKNYLSVRPPIPHVPSSVTQPRTLDPLRHSSPPQKYNDLAGPDYQMQPMVLLQLPLYDSRPLSKTLPNIPVPPLPSTNSYILDRPRQPIPVDNYQSVPLPSNGSYNRHAMPVPSPTLNPVCGLQNFGNTCYLNSLMQCLYNIKSFSHFFKSNIYVDYVHPVKGKSDSICLSYGLGSLFRVMEKHAGLTIAPTRFFGFLLKVSEFKQNEQQDAHEALLIILNRLHEELCDNDLALANFPRAFTRYSVDPDYDKWFDSKIEHEKLSPINGFFEGQQESVLCCQTCNFSSKSYSSFNVLSLNLPGGATKQSTTISIEELIQFYTQPEKLTGTQSWDCPKCRKERDRLISYEKEKMEQRHKEEKMMILNNTSAGDLFEPTEKESKSKKFFRKKASKTANSDSDNTLKILERAQTEEFKDFEERLRQSAKSMISSRTTRLLSLPSYLIVHVQRSIYHARLLTNVKYPLILEIYLGSGQKVRFKLTSTINHTGSSQHSGHYTALCNKSDHISSPRWCYFNDDQFTLDLSHGDLVRGIKRLTSHDVYLLFYERIDS